METLQVLRIVGVVTGVLGLVALWWLHFRQNRLRRGDWLLGSLLSAGLIVLGADPDLFNSFLSLFLFEKGGGQRLVGLLVMSTVFLFILVFVALSRASRAEQLTDRLVRELAKRDFRASHTAGSDRIYVIIPAYNEGVNIRAVLSRIPTEVLGLKTRTLVVVDGATDDTAAVVEDLDTPVVSYTVNRGGGSALKAGYEIAIEDGAELVVTLDADGQHLPEEIPRLVEPVLNDEADLVNGSRVLGHHEAESVTRSVGIVMFNLLISLLALQRVTDCSNSFRAIRTSDLKRLDLRESQFHASELLLEALKKGLRFQEVPITVQRRASGESKKPGSILYGWQFARAMISTWLR